MLDVKFTTSCTPDATEVVKPFVGTALTSRGEPAPHDAVTDPPSTNTVAWPVVGAGPLLGGVDGATFGGGAVVGVEAGPIEPPEFRGAFGPVADGCELLGGGDVGGLVSPVPVGLSGEMVSGVSPDPCRTRTLAAGGPPASARSVTRAAT